ncbi:unnamed protein product, partial [Rotaria sp. Silwood1]
SEMNVQQRIGGNSQLSPAGKAVLIAIVVRYSPLIIYIFFYYSIPKFLPNTSRTPNATSDPDSRKTQRS